LRRHDEVGEAIRVTGTELEQGLRTLPYGWYTDPRVAAVERERIFRRSWQYAGHVGELDGRGSFFPTHAGGRPVVVTRDADGALRAFVNVCRHRGALVATAPARRGTLQCPYHAWTYGLDGALRAAPRSDLEPRFERHELGLRAVAVDTWGPFVFVCPDPDAEPLAAALGDLPEVVAEHGLDVDGLRFHVRWPYELRANWKIAVENYLECYHCAVNHPGFVDAVDERALRLEASGSRLSQFAPVHPRAVATRAPYDVRGALEMSQFHLLLPAMKLNVCPGPPNLSIGPVWPLAPDRCAGWLDYFFAPEVDEAWIAEFSAWDFQVGAEDVALVEGVQAGAASGALPDGRLLEATEALIAGFQAYVRERVEPALDG
jgi:phenylpropionate dioxygenase-like ring-hydroxylating dioxygenase large terminal subunit